MVDMLDDTTVRSILESGGFVLEEVVRDSGYALEVHAPGYCHITLLRHCSTVASCMSAEFMQARGRA